MPMKKSSEYGVLSKDCSGEEMVHCARDRKSGGRLDTSVRNGIIYKGSFQVIGRSGNAAWIGRSEELLVIDSLGCLTTESPSTLIAVGSLI